MGGISRDAGVSITTDKTGNIYTTGFFSDVVDFDPGPGNYTLSAFGIFSNDVFISKFNTNGNFIWAVSFRGTVTTNSCTGKCIKTDKYSNVYAVGNFNGTVDFDPGPGTYTLASAGKDVFVSKLDSSGNFIWAKRFGGTFGQTEGNSIAIDDSGYVYTTGYLKGTSDFDPGPSTYTLTNTAGGNGDAYIVKLDSSGQFKEAINLGGGASSDGWGAVIDVDAFQNIVVSGIFRGTFDFDPGPATYTITSHSAFFVDGFSSKFNRYLKHKWTKRFGGTSDDVLRSMDTDKNGNIYITGNFSGTADFDPGPSIYNILAFSDDVFILKLDSAGNFIWANALGSPGSDFGTGITCDSAAVYLVGGYIGTMDLDPGPATYTVVFFGPANYNIFTLKLNANGNFKWAKTTMGSSAMFVNSAVALDDVGNVITTGQIWDSLNLNIAPSLNIFRPYNGGGDIFIQKIVPCDVPSQSISITGLSSVCAGNSVSLTGLGAISYSWSTGSNSPSVTVTPSITTTYSVIGTTNLGCINNSTINVNVNLCTYIETISNDRWILTPNPCVKEIGITGIKTNAMLDLMIFDAVGKLIFQTAVNDNQIKIDVTDFEVGVYFIKVRWEDKSYTKKFLKINEN